MQGVQNVGIGYANSFLTSLFKTLSIQKVSITFAIEGDIRKWNDAINNIETLEMDLRKQSVQDAEKAAIELTQSAKSKAHVITGNMRNSIKYRSASEGAYSVTAEIEYAIYENARGYPHDFFDQAVEGFESQFRQIIQNGVNAVVSSYKNKFL